MTSPILKDLESALIDSFDIVTKPATARPGGAFCRGVIRTNERTRPVRKLLAKIDKKREQDKIERRAKPMSFSCHENGNIRKNENGGRTIDHDRTTQERYEVVRELIRHYRGEGGYNGVSPFGEFDYHNDFFEGVREEAVTPPLESLGVDHDAQFDKMVEFARLMKLDLTDIVS